MRANFHVVWSIFAVVALPGLACGDEPDAKGIEFFEKKVRPLFVEYCLDCHTGDEPESGFSMDSFAGLLRGGLRGPALVPGEPDRSLLISAVRHGELLKMPPKKKLSTPEVAAMVAWVKLGAPWPNAEVAELPKQTTGEVEIEFTDEQRAFWSLQPPVRPARPAVQDESWIKSPIDAFILRQLEGAGFRPASAADKRTLIRRATLDLIGLPPTPEEVDAFLADDSPAAFAKVIDRLLESPRYGERWGRHWLDVARYADSNGLDENLAFANAYHYRDYVVAAFNKDKPYDQFVIEQIAGDLITPATLAREAADWDAPYEGTVATGFLTLGAKMLAEDDPVKMQMDIIDEQVDTLGRAFLGQTFGCARCHDHKFDPILTSDYYGLAGIFKSTKTMENFNVVAKWQEKPLASAEANKAREDHRKKIDAKQAEVDAFLKEKNAVVLSEARRRTGHYLLAALEQSRLDTLLSSATVFGDDPDVASIPGAILREAEDYSRGNVTKDTTQYGEGIGVLVNRGELPNFVEYDIELDQAGLYQLEIRVAAAASRPCSLSINGAVVKKDVAGAVTGTWYPDSQKWFVEGFYKLSAGKNVVRLEHAQFFPHIDKLLFVPARDTSPSTKIEQFAAVGDGQAGKTVLIEAEEALQRGNLQKVADGYGEGIGIVGGPGGKNEGEFELDIPTAGSYHIAIRYAAAEARPARLSVNGKLINTKATGDVTGSWYPDTQRWSIEGRTRLGAGKAVVRLERQGPISHIDKLLFIDSSLITGDDEGVEPLSEYEPSAELARQWSEYLAKPDEMSPFRLWREVVDGVDHLSDFAAQTLNALGGEESAKSPRELAKAYEEKIASLVDADPPANDPVAQALHAAIHSDDGPFKAPENIEAAYDEQSRTQLTALRDEKKKLDETLPQFPMAMAVSDGEIEDIRIHIRGSHLTKGRVVQRRFPKVMSDGEPVGKDRSGRLELARWIGNDSHPLTARVLVNRVWKWHFGEGLVRSPDNFGKLGQQPTHPELLDWLAVDFVESGWSMKQLHRRLMLSSTYQMSTSWNESAMETDPDNKLWWRFNRRRLEAEAIRDSLLATSGLLDLSMRGSMLPTKNRAYVTSTANVDPVAYQTNRRSVYVPVVRSALYEVFQAFDFAEPSVSNGQRQTTTVAPQALFMMNSQFVRDQTRAMAERLLAEPSDDEARVQLAYRQAYGRSAELSEVDRALEFVDTYFKAWRDRDVAEPEARLRAWQGLSRAVLAANEFIFVE